MRIYTFTIVYFNSNNDIRRSNDIRGYRGDIIENDSENLSTRETSSQEDHEILQYARMELLIICFRTQHLWSRLRLKRLRSNGQKWSKINYHGLKSSGLRQVTTGSHVNGDVCPIVQTSCLNNVQGHATVRHGLFWYCSFADRFSNNKREQCLIAPDCFYVRQ